MKRPSLITATVIRGVLLNEEIRLAPSPAPVMLSTLDNGNPRRRSLPHIMMGLMAALLAAAPETRAAELWMFTLPDCGPCVQFEREVGDRYTLTEEGRRAPLRHWVLDAGRPPELTGAGPVHGAPTFVLMNKSREVGRIVGYSSDELFWMRLSALLADLPAEDRDPTTSLR